MATKDINASTLQNETTASTSTPVTNNNLSAIKTTFMTYFLMILTVIIKPFTSFKEELNKFNDFKNSSILALVVAGGATVLNLISSMLNAVIVKSYHWVSLETETKFVWENIKELNYLELIGKNFIIYLAIIAAVAGLYYIASLILKKQISFARLLGIASLAVVPMLIATLFLSPVLSLVWAELSMPATIIGAVYTIVLLYEAVNKEIQLEGNAKYYFNLICFSILGIAVYYLYMELFTSSISGDYEDVLDFFG